MWTAGLVLLSSLWRVWAAEGSWHPPLLKVAGLCLGLFWGAMIAWVQLQLTWELSSVTEFSRPSYLLADFLFPPAHWAQFALPEVFLGHPRGAGDLYWSQYQTLPTVSTKPSAPSSSIAPLAWIPKEALSTNKIAR